MSDEPPIVICAPVGFFDDDVYTVCHACHTPVVHRPDVPADALKLCGPCAAALLIAMRTPPRVQH